MSETMLIHKGFRFRVYPTQEQEARLLRWESALRFLWNLAHEQRLLGLSRPSIERRRYYTAFDQINELTALRSELAWLADVPRNICAQLLIDLDKAWQRCFKRIDRRPHWRRKGSAIGFTEATAKRWSLDAALLRFPKIGYCRVVAHRSLEGTPKACTLRRDGDQWFASIVCEIEVPQPTPRTIPVVALDRGVINIVADSDGNLVKSPRFHKRSLKRLARADRTVSRRKKGSKNRDKAKLRSAKIHRKIRRQREHVIHDLSHTYAKSHGTVVVENLTTANLIHRGGGIARSILDTGWRRLVQCLQYKLAWTGGCLVEVSAHYSSQTCSVCTAVDAISRQGEKFCCTNCGHTDHADLNAAKVLKARANRSCQPMEASGTPGRRSGKVKLRVTRNPQNLMVRG